MKYIPQNITKKNYTVTILATSLGTISPKVNKNAELNNDVTNLTQKLQI